MKNRKFSALTAIVSAALAASIIFASGCDSKPAESNSESKTTEAAVSATVNQTDSREQSSDTTAPAISSGEESTAAEAATLAASETMPAAPASTQEIVALFNTSANRIKAEASKVVKNYEKRTVNEDKLVIPSSIESAARSMMNTFMKDDTDPIVYETREDIRSEFLVPDQSYVSKLKAEDVEKAVCTDNGDEYIIYFKLKTQQNPTAGVGVGSVCDVIETAEVAEKASFVEKFTTEYYNCEVKATIDKASGRVTHINYTTPLVLNLTVNMFGTHDVAVGFTFEKDYSITY